MAFGKNTSLTATRSTLPLGSEIGMLDRTTGRRLADNNSFTVKPNRTGNRFGRARGIAVGEQHHNPWKAGSRSQLNVRSWRVVFRRVKSGLSFGQNLWQTRTRSRNRSSPGWRENR